MTPSDPTIPTDWRVDYGPRHARQHAYFREREKALSFAVRHTVDGVPPEIVALTEVREGEK